MIDGWRARREIERWMRERWRKRQGGMMDGRCVCLRERDRRWMRDRWRERVKDSER